MASGASVGWIFVNLVGSVCVNLGQNVMKLGHNKWAELELPEEERPNIKCIRQWQIGVVVFISGGVATFLSFGYAPQSLLSALGSIQFVSNVVFASFVLKEKVTLRVVVATCGIVAGCILLVIFSSKSSVLLTVPELMSYYKHPAYITYIVCVVVVAAAFYATYRYGKRIIKHPPYPHYWDRLLPVAYMMYASPLGTQAILFSKSVSTLLRATLAGDSQLGYWFTYVILVAFIFTIIFWATRLDKSLKLFPAIVIVPTMQIGWTIFSIISGGIYFQEFQGYSPLQMGMFVLGVATIMVSVFFLTPSTADKYTEMEDMSAREAPLDVTDNTLAEPLSPGYRTSSDEELPQRVVNVKDLVAAWAESPRATPHIGLQRLSLDGHPATAHMTAPSRQAGEVLNRSSESGGVQTSEDAGGEEQEHGRFREQLQWVRDALREDFDLDIMKAFQRLKHMGTDRAVTLSPVTGMPIGTCPGWYTDDNACCGASTSKEGGGAEPHGRLTRSMSGPADRPPFPSAGPTSTGPVVSASFSVGTVAGGAAVQEGARKSSDVMLASEKVSGGAEDIVVNIVEPESPTGGMKAKALSGSVSSGEGLGTPPACQAMERHSSDGKGSPCDGATHPPERRSTVQAVLSVQSPPESTLSGPISRTVSDSVSGSPAQPLSASKFKPSRPPPPRPAPSPGPAVDPPPPPPARQASMPKLPESGAEILVEHGVGWESPVAEHLGSPPMSDHGSEVLTPLTEASGKRPGNSTSDKWLPGRKKSLRSREKNELDEPLRQPKQKSGSGGASRYSSRGNVAGMEEEAAYDVGSSSSCDETGEEEEEE